MRRKDYYKAEVFRALIYPIVFLLVVFLFALFNIYYGEPIDLNTYVNLSIISLVASLICYLLSYLLVKGGRSK